MTGGIESQGRMVVDASLKRPSKALKRINTLLIHWPEAVFWGKGKSRIRVVRGIASLLTTLVWLKSRETKIIWIVHNAYPHEFPSNLSKRTWQVYSRLLSHLVDGWVTLSPSTKPVVLKHNNWLRKTPWRCAWHPAYPAPSERDQNIARRRLDLPETSQLLLHAGLRRPYKGLENLITACKTLNDANIRLVICGKANNARYAEFLASIASTDPRITLRFGRLSDYEFDLYLVAADLVVAPFKDILHSGSVVHALSAGRPVLTASFPFTRDLALLVGQSWLRLFEGELMPQDLVRDLPGKYDNWPDLNQLSCERFGQKIVEFSDYLHSLNN